MVVVLEKPWKFVDCAHGTTVIETGREKKSKKQKKNEDWDTRWVS